MFKNIEKKLKTIATVNSACGFLLAGIAFLYSVFGRDGDGFIIGLLLALIWVLIGYVSSWGIYAFAELLETTKEMNRTLELAFQENINKTMGEKLKAEEEKKKKEEELRKSREMAEAARREAEAEVRREREAKIAAYWNARPDERQALLGKKQEAEMKLKKISGIAGDERKTIQDLIEAIDNELKKDR